MAPEVGSEPSFGRCVKNARDTITAQGVRTAKPLLNLTTTQATKKAKVKYGVALDPRGRDKRTFEVDLGMARKETARVYGAPHGSSLVIAPAGPAKPVQVKIGTVVGTQVKKASFSFTPRVAGEAIRIRPQDWASSLANVVVERLTNIEGAVLERVITKTRPR